MTARDFLEKGNETMKSEAVNDKKIIINAF